MEIDRTSKDEFLKRKKVEERILFTSLLSILLCCVMLAGSTLAWYTASVSTNVTSIQTGSLNFALNTASTYGEGGESNELEFVSHSTLVKNENGEEVETEAEPVREPVRWQPGDVYTLQPMFVENTGTIDMQYQVYLSFKEYFSDYGDIEDDDEKEAAARENLKLLQALKFTVFNVTEEDQVVIGDFTFPGDITEFESMITEVKDSNGNVIGCEVNKKLLDNELFLAASDGKNESSTCIAIKITMPLNTGAAFSGKALRSIKAIVNASQVVTNETTAADYTPVSNAEELFTAVGRSGRIALMNSIDLGGQCLDIAEGKEIVLDLQGYQLTSAVLNGSLISNEGKLTMIGGTLSNMAEGGVLIRSAQGEVVLTGVTLQNNNPNQALDGGTDVVFHGDFELSKYCDAENYTIGNDSDGNYTIQKK